MSIASLTSDGLTIACLLLDHEWSARLSVSHRFPGSVTTGVSGREGRRVDDDSFRFVAAVHLVLEKDDAKALRQQLATLGKGWVGVPLWMDKLAGSSGEWATKIYLPERIVDLTAPVILPKDAALDDTHTYAPLLVGHIDQLPELTPIDDEDCELSFTLVEDSPRTFLVGINAVAEPGVWPEGLVPDWSSQLSDLPQHGLTFEQIGEMRERMIEGEERAFIWGQAAEFWLSDRNEIRTLLAFFFASQGLRQSFIQPWWLRPGSATAEAPHSTTVRFGSDTLTLDYFSDSDATAKISVTQLPWEIAGVDGEEPLQPSRAFFYKVIYALPTPVVYRFTNWPRPLVRAGDGTYLSAPFKHRELDGDLELGNQVSIDSFIFEGNPLTMFHPNIREGRVMLSIMESETEPISADTATVKWFGELRSVKPTGRKLDAAGVFLGRILDRQLPNVEMSDFCQTSLFSSRCTLLKSAFLKTGTFTSAAGCVLDIATAAGEAENILTHGSIEIGAGAAWEVRSISASVPITGGQRITVDFPVRQAAAGQAVAFYRGCDRLKTTCKSLGNFANYRGWPNRPTTNLSLPRMETPGSPGKK